MYAGKGVLPACAPFWKYLKYRASLPPLSALPFSRLWLQGGSVWQHVAPGPYWGISFTHTHAYTHKIQGICQPRARPEIRGRVKARRERSIRDCEEGRKGEKRPWTVLSTWEARENKCLWQSRNEFSCRYNCSQICQTLPTVPRPQHVKKR